MMPTPLPASTVQRIEAMPNATDRDAAYDNAYEEQYMRQHHQHNLCFDWPLVAGVAVAVVAIVVMVCDLI